MVRQSALALLIISVLSSHIYHAYAVNFLCLWCCKDPGDEPPNPPAKPTDYRRCKNRPIGPDSHMWAPDGGWACDQSKVDFPTVECLAADMKACGNVGKNSVFYSFGARTVDARPFRDSLVPQGTMYNDALDGDYIDKVIQAAEPKYALMNKANRAIDGLSKGMNRQDIYTARAIEAFAQVSTDTAYVVILDYNGDPQANAGGQKGAFQNPLPLHVAATGNPNIDFWVLYELPTLQRNPAIKEIISVDLEHTSPNPMDEGEPKFTKIGRPPWTQHQDWVKKDDGTIDNERPASYAGQLILPEPKPDPAPVPLPGALPGPPGVKYRYKRDGPTACPADGPASSAPAVTSPPAAKPPCDHQDSTPEVESEYCVCQGSVTLPVLSASPGALNDPTKSCDYASLPDAKAQITTTAPPEPLTTNSARCEVCSVAGKNNQECTTMPNCIPQTPKAWVEVGNSAVHVGTLTSMALSSSISSALASICPEVTQTASMTNCTDQTVKIDGIWYKDPADDELNKVGQLEVKVTASQYNATSLRNAMINSAALTAMQSAAGKNCYTESYTVSGAAKKRSYLDTARAWLGLQERDGPGAYKTKETMDMCQATRFAGVQYLPPYWKECDYPCKPEDNFMWLDAEWDFKVAPGGTFACDFINGLIDALAVVAPEFAIEDVELGSAIDALCKEAIDHANRGGGS